MVGSRCAWVALALVGALSGCQSGGDDGGPNNPPVLTAGNSGAVAPGGSGVGGSIPPLGTSGTGGSTPVSTAGASGAAPVAGVSGGGSGTGVPPVGGTGGTGPIISSGTGWPMMGYDERNWYFNPNETTLTVANAPMLVEKWRFTVAGYPPGTPVIGEGKVFVMATGGTYGIDLQAGTMVWARTDLRGTASVAHEPGFVYVHDSAAQLWKLDATNGMTVWGPVKTYSLASCDGTSSPILGGEMVVVGHSCGALEIALGAGGARGGVEARKRSDGSMGWSYWTVDGSSEDGAMIWSSVGIDVAGGVVYAASGNNYTMLGANSDAIHALDLAAGTVEWISQVRDNDLWSLFGNPGGPDTDFGANPIIAEIGGQPVVAAGDKGSAFWSLNRTNGDVLWSRDALTPSRNQANGGILMNGAFDGETFYALVNDPVGSSTKLVALGGGNMGADKWPAKDYPGKLTWGAPSLANGLLVVPVDDLLYVLDAANGTQLNMFMTGGTIAAGAAAIAEGKIIVGSGLTYPLGSVTLNDKVICYGLP